MSAKFSLVRALGTLVRHNVRFIVKEEREKLGL